MDPNSRLLMMGAGTQAGLGTFADPGDHILFEYDNSGTRLAVVNIQTNTLVSDFPVASISQSASKSCRLGNSYLRIGYDGSFQIYNLSTGALINSGSSSSLSPTSSFGVVGVKIDVDKVFVASVQSGQITGRIYSFANPSAPVLLANSSFSRSSVSAGGGNPVLVAQASFTSNAVLSSMPARVFFRTVAGGAPVYPFLIVGATIGGGGTSISWGSVTQIDTNYSRPTGASGDNGNCLLVDFDLSKYRVFAGSTPSNGVSAYNGNILSGTGGGACAIHGTNSYLIKGESSGTGFGVFNGSTLTYGGFQTSSFNRAEMIRGGAVAIWSASNVIYYRRYTASTSSWGSQTTVPGISGTLVVTSTLRSIDNF